MANTTTNKDTAANTTTTKENGWERIARRNLKNAYNWLVGETENGVLDGDVTQEEFQNWMKNDALDEIYHEAITTLYTGDSCGGEAPKEMRFAGKDFCYKYLISLFKKDGYTVTAPEAEPKKKSTKKSSTKSTSVTATLKAFTGMIIGTYTVKALKNGYKLTTKDGKVLEFNTEGIQTNAKNPKFGNKIEILDVAEA